MNALTRSRAWWALIVTVVLVNAGLFYSVATRVGAFGGKRVQVPVLTAQPGGRYVQLGEALRQAFASDTQARIELIPLPSNGSVENLEIAAKFENALAITFVKVPDYVRMPPATKLRYENVRAVALLNMDALQVVVSAASGIQRLTDLGNRKNGALEHRVYVGMTMSGTRETVRELLEAAFVGWKSEWDQDSRDLTFNEAAARLKRGEFDAAIFDTGFGAPAVRSLFAADRADFRMIRLDDDVRQRLLPRGYEELLVPAYPGSAPTETVGSRVIIAMHKDTQPWLVREVLDTIERSRAQLEPLLTPVTPGSKYSSALITDPEVTKSLLQNVLPHDALLQTQWLWPRSAWFLTPAFSLLLAVQLYLLGRLRPHERTTKISAGEAPDVTAAQPKELTAPWATVIAALVGGLVQLISRR